MSLLNTSWYLAIKGRKVLLWDFDMEAPGLQFSNLMPDGKGEWCIPNPTGGFKELIELFERKQLDSEEIFLKNFVHNLGPGNRITLFNSGKDVSDISYRRFVQNFSWAEFYSEKGGRHLLETLLKLFDKLDFDYLFVDARTGLTDVADITTIHIPDLVVAFTNLTNQSAKGIREIVKRIDSINTDCESGGSNSRRKDRRTTPIQKLLVGSPLPIGEWRERNSRIHQIEEIIGYKLDAVINHLPLLSLGEELQIVYQQRSMDLEEQVQLQSSAISDYEVLADKIISLNPGDVEYILRFGKEVVNNTRWRDALPYVAAVASSEEKRENFGKSFWEASVAKARAIAQIFDTEESKKILNGLKRRIPGLINDIDGYCKDTVEYSPNTLNYTQSEALKLWTEGQMALSWSYVLLTEYEKAYEISKELVTYLGKRVEDSQVNQALKNDLTFYFAFANWITGQAAQDCGETHSANDYYDQAIHFYRELRVKPFEIIICMLKQANNYLYTHDVEKSKRRIDEAVGIYEDSPDFTIVDAIISLRNGQCSLAEGNLYAAWGDLNKAKELFEKESDRVAFFEAELDSLRAISIFGYQSDLPPREELFKNYEKMKFIRLSDEADEYMHCLLLLEFRKFAESNKFDLIFDHFRKGLGYVFGRVSPKNEFICEYLEELDFHKNIIEIYINLLLGELDKAKDCVNRCTYKENDFTGLGTRSYHEFKLLSAITKYCNGDLAEKPHILEYSQKRLKTGFRLEALQAYSVYALLAEADGDSDWLPNLINQIKALNIHEQAPDGNWAVFLNGLLYSKQFRAELGKTSFLLGFDKIMGIASGKE